MLYLTLVLLCVSLRVSTMEPNTDNSSHIARNDSFFSSYACTTLTRVSPISSTSSADSQSRLNTASLSLDENTFPLSPLSLRMDGKHTASLWFYSDHELKTSMSTAFLVDRLLSSPPPPGGLGTPYSPAPHGGLGRLYPPPHRGLGTTHSPPSFGGLGTRSSPPSVGGLGTRSSPPPVGHLWK